jgi:hypothetical protein
MNPEWEKSSYSNGEGGQCVEFARNLAASTGTVPVRDSKSPGGPALIFSVAAWASFVTWEKSSYSSGEGGQCVEFARNLAASAGIIPVRDSKAPEGPALAFSPAAWTSFVNAVRVGRSQ